MGLLRCVLTAVIFGFYLPGTYGADRGGQFAIKGAGLLTCEQFVKARSERGEVYMLFGGWLEGYMTGVNQYSPDTYDISSWESTDLLASIIGEHCEKNRDHRFFQVVNSILGLLKQHRLTDSSSKVFVKSGNDVAWVYRDTLRRIQTVLKDKGHYRGAANGELNAETQQALEAYQRQKGLQVTGMPDQLTLWSLLRPPKE